MSVAETQIRSARRHLEIFEESWKADHDEAMDCRDLEVLLDQLTSIFRWIARASRARREHVFRSLVPPSSDLDALERDLYTRWLALAEELLEPLNRLEKAFGVVEGANLFRVCREAAHEVLARWVGAVPAQALGSRVWDVTEEEADELRALLESPAGSPGRLNWCPKPIPSVDTSVLR